MRKARIRAAILLIAFAWASPARSTVTLAVVNSPPDVGAIGELVPIEIRVSSDGSPVAALAASVWGYDSAVVRFRGGEAVGSLLHDSCSVGSGCSGGIVNEIAGPLSETSAAGQGPRVQFVRGDAIGATGPGDADPGLDGVIGGGDAQIRVFFQVVGVGFTQLQIGTGYPGDGVVRPGGIAEMAIGAVVTTRGVPDPSPAILLGMGLCLLAWRRIAAPRSDSNRE